MSDQWYYMDNQQTRQGPVSQEVLEIMLSDGVLPGGALVWAPHLPSWMPARQVADLHWTQPLYAPPDPQSISPPSGAQQPAPRPAAPQAQLPSYAQQPSYSQQQYAPPRQQQPTAQVMYGMDDEAMIRSLSSAENTSGVVWLIIAILQILSCAAIIAGVWNIFAATTSFKLSKRILTRDPAIPSIYENMQTNLIITLVINLVLGGLIGALWVIYDFNVRSRVLANAHLFTGR